MWSPGVTLAEMEKQVIEKAFSHFKGNKTHTASALGIAIRTLDAKLLSYVGEKQAGHDREEYLRQRELDHLSRARGLTTDHAHHVKVVVEPRVHGDQVTILRKAKK